MPNLHCQLEIHLELFKTQSVKHAWEEFSLLILFQVRRPIKDQGKSKLHLLVTAYLKEHERRNLPFGCLPSPLMPSSPTLLLRLYHLPVILLLWDWKVHLRALRHLAS